MVRLAIDHLVISCERLEEGVAYVQDRLGVEMAAGGRHPAMGTHNRLLGMGEIYLEVIAIDPDADPPGRKRLFGLDYFRGPPRLTHFVARVDDLDAALALAPEGAGARMPLTRGDLSWAMTVPADGRLPFDDLFPAMIAWDGAAHPTQRLPETQVRLAGFDILHPQAEDLRAALSRYDTALAAHVVADAAPGLRATLAIPDGTAVLE